MTWRRPAAFTLLFASAPMAPPPSFTRNDAGNLERKVIRPLPPTTSRTRPAARWASCSTATSSTNAATASEASNSAYAPVCRFFRRAPGRNAGLTSAEFSGADRSLETLRRRSHPGSKRILPKADDVPVAIF